MIRVLLKPEPENFNSLVREPGNAFLSICPNPNSKQFEKHPYWRSIGKRLCSDYDNICSFCCQIIHDTTGFSTVEHFKPKVAFPSQAYEWSNYRLVCGKLNARKGNHQILDPFEIEDEWFLINFPSLLIYPNPELDTLLKAKISYTISILKLNNEGDCVRCRTRYIEGYCQGKYGLDHLYDEAPFLAKELVRQGLEGEIKLMWNNAK